MNDIRSILAVPFTGLGKPGFRGNRWLKNRIRVFRNFVLPSLVNQTRKEFTIWCQWRRQEKDNPIVQEFINRMEQIRGMRFVHTFHGITLWDDKYPHAEAERKLKMSLNLSLPELKETVGEADWVYLTCQPSDDIYAVDFIEQTRDILPARNSAIVCREGYMMNYASKEIREYNPHTLPPFATVMFPANTFLDPDEHYRYVGPYESHEHLTRFFHPIELKDRLFMVGTHGENISTTWNHPYCGREILGDEHIAVMAQFGCLEADPVVIHRRLRLWGRILVNLLPGPLHDFVRKAYNSLRSVYFNLK